ncbi:restriction endonuclease subunit S [Pseudoalteromonas sp. SG43-7]|uniref:restriction endonuclease subunit S n=1 Tax=Pseudoalteromonas sp. SG43-7 TaxID=2760966 RepID=UPI0016002EC4|nr:restriction endonuclease subunit S [Pseudoalteromonas sp. SG43-7]MBB1420910.1 restriction endonuclease subunit S [Pseudoalteromonas sp. SG43-7]
MSQLSYMKKLLDGVEVQWESLGNLCVGISSGRNKKKSEGGLYPVFGSTGVIGRTDTLIYKHEQILVARVGANAGRVNIAQGEYDVSDNTLIINTKECISLKYLYYFLVNINLNKFSQGAGQPLITAKQLKSLPVPIPCPDNPEESLAIQAEIVRILDGFNALIAELTTELNMRKKQYSHYQFELLKFTETTQQISIGECCDIKKGATPIKKATPGKFPLVATTEERQSSSEYQFDCPAVCVPLISSRGHGVASIDRIYYQNGKFALGNILCAIIPNDSEVLSAKFLRYYLFDKKDVMLVPLMRGGANVSLTMDSLKKVKIPIPPIADQQRIVCALDKFDEFVKALPCEIELRQKQYEYYRDMLLSFPQSHSDETA